MRAECTLLLELEFAVHPAPEQHRDLELDQESRRRATDPPALLLRILHSRERLALFFLRVRDAQHGCIERKAQAARHMVYHAGRLADLGEDARSAAMLAKLQAVAAAELAADEGIQILGGYGYVVEYHVERHYRDAKSLEVMDGVAEALRDELASQM